MNSYNIHAGHNPSKKIGCGAVGFLDESIEDRKICKYVVKYLKKYGFKCYDCTVNNGKNANDVLSKICLNQNKHITDFNISIHLNSGRNDLKGDKSVGGSEVWLHSYILNERKKDNCKPLYYLANYIKKSMGETIGKDRGIKYTKDLYVLNYCYNNSMLLEVCFVDDKEDFKNYDYKKMANSILNAILLYEIDSNFDKNKWLKNKGFSKSNYEIVMIKNKRYLIEKNKSVELFKNRKKIFL